MNDGLTPEERVVAEAIFAANAAYAALPVQHPLDTREWMGHIHGLQGLVTARVVRRDYPDCWPSHEPERPRLLARMLGRRW